MTAGTNSATQPLIKRPIQMSVVYTVVVSLPVFLAGAFGVRLKTDLGFGTAELGFALSGFPLGGAISAGWLGPFVDRIGAAASLRLASAVSALSSLVVAWMANGWLLVGVAMFLCGFGNSMGQMACNRLLVRWVVGRRQGLALGTKQAAVPVASAAAGLVVALLGGAGDWQVVYTVAAAVAISAAIAGPRPAGGRRPSDRRAAGTQHRRLRGGLLPLIATAMIAGTGGSSLALLVVDSFDHAGFADSTGAAVLALGSAASVMTRLGAGWFVDRRRSSGLPELITLLAAGGLGFTLLSVAGGRLWLLTTGALVAFAAGWGWNGVLYYTVTRDPEAPPAATTGMVLSGIMVGSFVGPLLVAVVADHLGYAASWRMVAVMSALAVGSALVSVVLRRRARPAERPR